MASEENSTALAASSLFNVNGLVALVTGGGSGMGLSMARALGQNGAHKVYIVGRRLDVLEAAAASIGPNVVPVKCDITSKADLQEAAAFVEKDAGYLNLLVCNAGILGPVVTPPGPTTTIEEWADRAFALNTDDYMRTFSVNTAGVFFTTMAFLKLLDKGNKKGNVEQTSQVLINSSIACLQKISQMGSWAYTQSKAAIMHTAKMLSVILPEWDIRVNVVAPGWFPSEALEGWLKENSDAGRVSKDIIPLQRVGNGKDIAGMVLNLASRAGAYYNGAMIVIDGGRLAKVLSIY